MKKSTVGGSVVLGLVAGLLTLIGLAILAPAFWPVSVVVAVVAGYADYVKVFG